MWDAVRFVVTPYTLAAFIFAAVAMVACAYLRRRVESLKSVKQAERASVSTTGDVRTSELDMSNITREHKFALASKSMDQRIERLKLFTRLLAIVVVVSAITLVVLVALPYLTRQNPEKLGAEKLASGEVKLMGRPIAQSNDGDLDEIPIPPPENFPSPEVAGVAALTEDNRSAAGFADTRVMIRNETGKRLQVLFSYRPYKKRDPQASATDYVHRSTQYIMPGVTFEHHEENFGGPVHVSINTDRKWIPTNEWMDLKVVPRRTLVVKEDRSSFSCRVEYEGSSP